MDKSATGSTLEAGVQIGDFRIEERLGAGGMGIVYRARQISLNRIVALKVLGNALTRSGDIIRFQREAQAAARLNHPNVATVHFVGQDDQVCYMAIEYIEGPSLARIIRCLATAGDPQLNLDSVVETIQQAEPRAPTIRFDRTTETLGSQDAVGSQEYGLDEISEEAQRLAQSAAHIRRCCELVRDAAQALDHAHGKSVVHRDIKPENLLLDKDGHVHVIDFGIARFFEDATVTQTGRLVGTPMYMSPEQVTARLDVDHRTDIYSLGLVLYELLTLRPAMLAPTREGVLRNIVTKALPPVSSENPGVSQDLEAVLHKATGRDPDERYQTAAELAADLQRCLDGKPVAAKPYRYQADLSEIEATRPRSVLALSIAVQAVSLVLGLFGIVFLFAHLLDPDLDMPFIGSGLLSIGSAMFILGWGLVSGYSWGRRLALELAIVLGGLTVWGLIDELFEEQNGGFSWGLLFFFLPISLSIALFVVTSRRKTRDWLVRAKRVRAECMRGNKVFLGAIGAFLAALAPVAFVGNAMQAETEYRDNKIEKYLEEEKYRDAEMQSRIKLIRLHHNAELPEGNWKIGYMMTLRGASLSGQEKFEEAEPQLLDGYSQMKNDPEVSDERMQEALQRIIELYEAWGKPDKAAEYRAILAHNSDAGEATHP